MCALSDPCLVSPPTRPNQSFLLLSCIERGGAFQRFVCRVCTRLMETPKLDEDSAAVPGEGYIFVLEKATLEAAKIGKAYQILNCDDHANFLRRHGKDPANFRPDIVHQELLAILDSPLNKAGRVNAVYVHTQKNVLIKISSQTRIPRTFKRFCGLMVQLLQKLSIRAANGPEKLFKVVKGPVTKYFPAGARRVGFSFSAADVKDFKSYINELPSDACVIFTLGAMSHGMIVSTYTDDLISVSHYPLSGACCIARITNCLENKFGIL